MQKAVLLDGAAGTVLWQLAEEKGLPQEPVWKYNLEAPELVLALHRQYIEAGSEMIQTNTFDANRFSVSRSSSYTVEEVVKAAVKLALKAAEGTDVKVYASFGPLAQMMEPFGNLTKEEAEEVYREMCSAAAEAGVSAIMLETFMDVEMAYAAARAAVATGLPVICSLTFTGRQSTMMGNTVEQIVRRLEPLGIAGIGMNCSFGPVEALAVMERYREATKLPLYLKPNAGVGEAYGPEQFADEVGPALSYVSYIGGCCGCGADYIAELKKRL